MFLLDQTANKKKLIFWSEALESHKLDPATRLYFKDELWQLEDEFFCPLRKIGRLYNISSDECDAAIRRCLAEISAMPLKNAIEFIARCAALENDWSAEKLRVEIEWLLRDDKNFDERLW